MPNTATPQKASLFGALHVLADEIQSEKQAAARVKQAGPTPSDPGGYQGATSHPVKDVDNNVQSATEGARSSENESDVKDEIGKPSVNSAPDLKDGASQDQQLQIGTKKAPTGEDPASEDDYKGNKDDPGTSHPAMTEDGEKYGSASFKEAHDRSATLANDILADLANGFGSQLTKKASPPAAAPAAPAASAPQQPQTLLGKAAAAVKQPTATDQAVQAGYELAAALGIEKTAAQGAVQGCIDQTIRDAHIDADLLGGYLSTFQKRAEGGADEAEGGEDHSGAGDEASGASDAPPDAGGAGGGGLEALLGGGGGGGDLGGGAPMGGDPMGGGMEPDGDEGLGGAPNEEEALQELAAALEELGIPIEALAQAGGGGGGDMGGAPAGGPPPADPGAGAGAPPPEGEGMKLAKAVQRFKLSGKYQIKQASTKRARHIRDVMKAHVRELLGLK